MAEGAAGDRAGGRSGALWWGPDQRAGAASDPGPFPTLPRFLSLCPSCGTCCFAPNICSSLPLGAPISGKLNRRQPAAMASCSVQNQRSPVR
jgi:hypothetical protein